LKQKKVNLKKKTPTHTQTHAKRQNRQKKF